MVYVSDFEEFEVAAQELFKQQPLRTEHSPIARSPVCSFGGGRQAPDAPAGVVSWTVRGVVRWLGGGWSGWPPGGLLW